MSALTYEVKDRQSPVAEWLKATFPQHKDVQAQFRLAAGPQQVMMPPGVAPGTQGAAIDFWLRMLVDPQPSIALPLIALVSGRAPCRLAGRELLSELAGGEPPRRAANGETELRMHPAGFADRDDEWWARVCYALALLVELYRAVTVEHSRLMRLHERSRAADLLELASDDEVADLIAMRDLARERLLPALPAGPVATGMTFDGSADLNADADLIAGGTLIDFKAGQGGKPRTDGTRAAALDRAELDQLLGYALMDYSDTFGLHTVGIYAVRFGHFAAWPLTELGQRMGGRSAALADLRAQFAQVLRTQLPPYGSTAARRRRCAAGELGGRLGQPQQGVVGDDAVHPQSAAGGGEFGRVLLGVVRLDHGPDAPLGGAGPFRQDPRARGGMVGVRPAVPPHDLAGAQVDHLHLRDVEQTGPAHALHGGVDRERPRQPNLPRRALVHPVPVPVGRPRLLVLAWL